MSGRRAGGERRGPVSVAILAVVLVMVVALVAILLDPRVSTETEPGAPVEVPLDAVSLVCPTPDPTAGTAPASVVGVASLAGEAGETGETGDSGDGEVTASSGAEPLAVTPVGGPVAGGVAVVGSTPTTGAGTDEAATVVRATGDLARGLVAARSVASPLAATPCRRAEADQWFSGVGAAAEHTSVLELANAEDGPAVAEVTVYSGTGVVDVPALRGLAVPAGATTRLDLSQLVPRRGDLGLRVQVTRGRLGVSVLDRQDPLTGAAPLSDWLPAQAEPAADNLLLGLVRGDGARTLEVTNPGDDEVSVGLVLLTRRATFEPEGLEELRVPPASTASLSLDSLLGEATRRGAVGLRVQASGPVTASLRQVIDDLSLLAPVEAVVDPTVVVVPSGRARLQLSSAGVGTATVTATDAAGGELLSRSVDLTPDLASVLALPAGTASVRLDPGPLAGQLRGVVLVQDPGATVLAATDLPRATRVAQVAPGLP